MTFGSANIDKNYKSGYLYADDIADDNKPISEELLKSIPPTKKYKRF